MRRRGADAVDPPPCHSPASAPRRPCRCALVVEVDGATRRLCRAVLQGAGFSVDEADTGIAAVVAARRSLPDLVLVALQLPDVPGRQAVAWLRSNPALRTTPILVLGGEGEDDAPTGPDTLLRKPFTPEALRRRVREVLSSGSLATAKSPRDA
jgi:DNA-binding response OmpR family regulator